MRKHWVNLIIHTTAYANNTKRKIITSNFIGIIINFIILIFLELFLSLISIPLYFIISSKKEKNNTSFRLRKAITFSSLGAILFIWILKLIIILVFSYKAPYEIKNKIENQVLSQEELVSSFNINSVDSSPLPPEIKNVEESSSKTIFSGETSPNTSISLFIHKKDDLSREIEYSQKSDQEGKWQVIHLQEDFYLPAGEYLAYATAFNPEKEIKSNPSRITNVKISNPLSQQFLSKLDYWVNISTLSLILLGVISTILII